MPKKKSSPVPKKKASGKNCPALPLAPLHLQLQRGKPKGTVTAEVPLFISAAMEYFVSEIMVEAARQAQAEERPSIRVQDIQNVVNGDLELKRMVSSVTNEEVEKMMMGKKK